MAWQPYVDSHLVGTGHVTKATIVGIDGSLWATTPGFGLAANEAKGINEGFKDVANFQANGIKVGGVKYMYINKPTDTCVYGKKGATGILIYKTKKAYVIAFHDDKVQTGNCTTTTTKIGDYLVSQNY